MNVTNGLKRIALRFPECNPEFEEFPSGAAMLHLTLGEVWYCAEYVPSLNLLGLSKVEGSSPFWEGVDESFKSTEELEARIVEILGIEGTSR